MPGRIVMKKRSKFGNVKTRIGDLTFDSKKESERWVVLKAIEESGEITNLERQHAIVIEIKGVKVCTYFADFKYYRFPRWVYEDVKGVKTQVYALKKKLVKACYGIEIVEI